MSHLELCAQRNLCEKHLGCQPMISLQGEALTDLRIEFWHEGKINLCLLWVWWQVQSWAGFWRLQELAWSHTESWHIGTDSGNESYTDLFFMKKMLPSQEQVKSNEQVRQSSWQPSTIFQLNWFENSTGGIATFFLISRKQMHQINS